MEIGHRNFFEGRDAPTKEEAVNLARFAWKFVLAATYKK